ncbi:MAG: MlaE family ABC transporter permease [Candidatus Binataceae bacterium]
MSVTELQSQHGKLAFDRADDATLMVRLSGPWHLSRDLPPVSLVIPELQKQPVPKRLSYDTSSLTAWDSGLVSFLIEVDGICRQRGIKDDREGLPAGLKRLIELAEAVPEKEGARAAAKHKPLTERVGDLVLAYSVGMADFLSFFGDLSVALAKFVRGKARYRTIDLMEVVQQCGPQAVGIVCLISFLVGIILAFMGAVQLAKFGAAIYVADLVGVGMVRDMGAMMTAIIMSGRTGAAFAAKLGTMKVTQEIDAFTTMGISPLEFLVLPRVLALVMMMPLLCLFADFVGIMGGAFVGVTVLDLSLSTYMRETISTLTFVNFAGGLIKGTTYGGLIALAGCLRGFQCGDSSSAVGDAATAAVVMSIVLVVAACGVFAVAFNFLHI